MQLRLLLQLTHVLVGVSCFSRSLAQQVQNRFLDDFKRALKPIYPGTLWCGPGDRAKDLNDVGLFKDSDACCREHDNCPDDIPGWGSKHGLVNKGPFTKSHCDCDDRFFQCLKDVMRDTKSLVAPQIGIAYFNVVGPQCFKEEYPIVKCAERHTWPQVARSGLPCFPLTELACTELKQGCEIPSNRMDISLWLDNNTQQEGWLFRLRCKRYELDTSRPKEWQWFDPKVFF